MEVEEPVILGLVLHIAILLLWCEGTDVYIRLICCGVQDEIDEDTGLTVEDIGDYLFDE